MGSFAGWNFAGSFAYSFVNEGLNIVLNLFGGVVVNAARTIAYQIKNAITKVCQNAPLLSFTHKAPTFTSWGFVIT